jgi:hypothetical protein
MKFLARFPGDSTGVPLDVAAGAPAFDVTLDGRALSGTAVEVRPGVWSLIGPDGRQIEVGLSFLKDGVVRASAGGSLFDLELFDELTARTLAAPGGRSARRPSHAAAAMPGRVLRVLVSAGDRVVQGQPLVVLEAMKMENEVKSPRDGRVASVEVASGAAVSAGDALVRFDDGAE